ncbi:MAG: phosphotransferase [Rickettsiales bacterium]|jgi:aminoglycoside phosphotransferase (APT) family kinase protein|nr:phosphotransferase [Rickettsiales bacterium]
MRKLSEFLRNIRTNLCFKTVRRAFPGETIEYLSRGKKSAAFITKSGKIIRAKPIYFGTYGRERRILDFIHANGGIGCPIPKTKTFIHGIFAISVHDDIGGELLKTAMRSRKKIGKDFARQLVAALTRLAELGTVAPRGFFPRKPKAEFLLFVSYCFTLRRFVRRTGVIQYFINLRRRARATPNHAHGSGLIHGDLHWSNIMVLDDLTPGLIDFDTVRFGPMEHNFRKIPTPLMKYMPIKNRAAFDYYRAMFLIKRIRNKPTSGDIAELKAIFE